MISEATRATNQGSAHCFVLILRTTAHTEDWNSSNLTKVYINSLYSLMTKMAPRPTVKSRVGGREEKSLLKYRII